MNICKHKRLLAWQLKYQFQDGFIINGEVFNLVPRTLKIYCEKCKEWQTLEEF